MRLRRVPTQALAGGVIVVVGILLLLETTGTLDVTTVWRFVPSVFVLLGVWALYRSGFRAVTGPVILIVVAGTVQLLVLDVVTGATLERWWPLLVVLLGVAVIASHLRGRGSVPAVAGDEFDLLQLFGGVSRRVTSNAFRGGAATAIFGGIEIDLREAAVADPPAVITAFALFGGVEVKVPDDWSVALDALPVFGGVEDDRPRRGDDVGHRDPDLVVTGVVAFGGITIT